MPWLLFHCCVSLDTHPITMDLVKDEKFTMQLLPHEAVSLSCVVLAVKGDLLPVTHYHNTARHHHLDSNKREHFIWIDVCDVHGILACMLFWALQHSMDVLLSVPQRYVLMLVCQLWGICNTHKLVCKTCSACTFQKPVLRTA